MCDRHDIDLALVEFLGVIRDQGQVPATGRAPMAPLEQKELESVGHGLTQDQAAVAVFDYG
jgi:hypothetical protein